MALKNAASRLMEISSGQASARKKSYFEKQHAGISFEMKGEDA